uniref:Uncharacterized protein n=1 Tax=Angiostrongylus cantonensis TaxID=6313 RepID=A0A0K0D7E3_ANGCA
MSIVLLLATSIALTSCGILDAGAKMNSPTSGRHDGQKAKHNKLTELEKEMATEPMGYDKILSKPICQINSRRRAGRALFESEIITAERQQRQIANGTERGEAGVRTKRQVLRKDAAANSTWTNGVFYTFNTSSSFSLSQRGFQRFWSDSPS